MLVYQVRELLSDPQLAVQVEEVVELSEIEFGTQKYKVLKAPVIRGMLRNLDGKTIGLTGTIDYTLNMPCDRCLEPVKVPVHLDLEQHFVQADERVEEDKDAEDAETFSGYLLDLSDFVRDEIYLSIPMKVLCSGECKGLCPQCGHNLNLGPCDCDLTQTDARWDSLKELLQGKDNQ